MVKAYGKTSLCGGWVRFQGARISSFVGFDWTAYSGLAIGDSPGS